MVENLIVLRDNSPRKGYIIARYLSTANKSNIPADAVVVIGPNAGIILHPTYPKCHCLCLVTIKYVNNRGLNNEAKKSIMAK